MSEGHQNKAVVQRFIDEYYRKGNMEIFDELLAPGFFFSGVGAAITDDLEHLKEVASKTHAMQRTAAPDLEFSIDEIIAEGSSVVVRLTERGTLTGPYIAGQTRIEPTGKGFEVTAVEVFHLEGGKITERWGVRDRLGFLQQIGASIQIE